MVLVRSPSACCSGNPALSINVACGQPCSPTISQATSWGGRSLTFAQLHNEIVVEQRQSIDAVVLEADTLD